jgi:hypothetical protein
MRKVLLAAAIVVLGLSAAMNASAFTKSAARFDAQGAPYGLVTDCTLNSANLCAGWIWVFNDVNGAVWGSVLDADDCPEGCLNGGAVSSIIFYSRCATVPGSIGGVGISLVDGVGCRTSSLYASGPMTVTHCIAGDRWTTVTVAEPPHLNHNPFAVTITWGPVVGSSNNPQFSTDNGIANLYCKNNPGTFGVFPGCATSTSDCTAWDLPPQRTFIYVTDVNGDGILDDFCAIYGSPYPLAFPYLYPYGYLPNNLIVSVGLDCSSPTATVPTSWGHVKSLYE